MGTPPQRKGHAPTSRQALSAEGFGLKKVEGRHTLHGLPLSDLASEFGSPLFVVDGERLDAQAQAVADLPAHVRVAFSYKTNAIWSVLQRLHTHGLGAEVVSGHELELARRLAVPADRTVFNGPAKGEAAVRAAWAREVLVNANSIEELEHLADWAKEAAVRPRVGVRFQARAGWKGQFGVALAQEDEAWARARRRREVELSAVHVHHGAALRDANSVRRLARGAFSCWLRGRRAGLPLTDLDLGGSLAVPTVRQASPRELRRAMTDRVPLPPPDPTSTIDLSTWAQVLLHEVAELSARHGEGPTRIWLEPGRALTASTHWLLTSVVETHSTDQDRYGILDAGMNVADVVRRSWHAIFPADPTARARSRTYRLVGPTCAPGDVLSPAIPLPGLRPGDVLAIADAGAYFDAFSTHFSFPRPAVVWVDREGVRLVRRRETTDDILGRELAQPPGR